MNRSNISIGCRYYVLDVVLKHLICDYVDIWESKSQSIDNYLFVKELKEQYEIWVAEYTEKAVGDMLIPVQDPRERQDYYEMKVLGLRFMFWAETGELPILPKWYNHKDTCKVIWNSKAI